MKLRKTLAAATLALTTVLALPACGTAGTDQPPTLAQIIKAHPGWQITDHMTPTLYASQEALISNGYWTYDLATFQSQRLRDAWVAIAQSVTSDYRPIYYKGPTWVAFDTGPLHK